ncbi:DUF1450 domain-containing protein [Sulfurovum sp. ST-21]|uniref:DUF1450 domain-containing protein n=1 Tax=Sulfurovum indicum TaxID=2779528 RepID=A0A7M1S4Y5_9BACT|nr:DUF1450 domain-containing protein [Sulfurovum indicum]QOR61420.1 DUF1450 domain-containing protein [Sulfurovum indicum]
MKIKICKHFHDIKKFKKKLSKTFPDDSVIVKSCIGMCKTCKQYPLAKIDGVKIKEKSIKKIIIKIEDL